MSFFFLQFISQECFANSLIRSFEGLVLLIAAQESVINHLHSELHEGQTQDHCLYILILTIHLHQQ